MILIYNLLYIYICMYIIYIYTISIHESLELDDAMGEDQAETRQGAQQKHFFQV